MLSVDPELTIVRSDKIREPFINSNNKLLIAERYHYIVLIAAIQ